MLSAQHPAHQDLLNQKYQQAEFRNPSCSLDACPNSFSIPLPQVRSICEEMTMDGCERCMPSWQAGKKWGQCDLLDTYSYLCYQMPGGWILPPKIAARQQQ